MGTGVSWGPSELMNDLAAVYGVDLPYRLPQLQAVQSGDGEHGSQSLHLEIHPAHTRIPVCLPPNHMLGSLLSPTSS